MLVRDGRRFPTAAAFRGRGPKLPRGRGPNERMDRLAAGSGPIPCLFFTERKGRPKRNETEGRVTTKTGKRTRTLVDVAEREREAVRDRERELVTQGFRKFGDRVDKLVRETGLAASTVRFILAPPQWPELVETTD